jgi:hypothetical protein
MECVQNLLYIATDDSDLEDVFLQLTGGSGP